MYCSKCGAKIGDNSSFCTKCGHQAKGAPQAADATPVAVRMGQRGTPPGRLNPRVVMLVGGAMLSLIVAITAVSLAGNAKKEKDESAALASQAAQQELLLAEAEAVEDTLMGYAGAMQSLDFEYAAEYWAPKRGNNARSATELLAEIPYGGILKGALPLLGRVANFKYELILLDDVIIDGDKASANVGIAMEADIIIDSSAGAYTVKLKKIDDVWLIESIKE